HSRLGTAAPGPPDGLRVSSGRGDEPPMLTVYLAVSLAAAPTAAERCGKLFDQMQPDIVQRWSKSISGDELAGARRDLPLLRRGFVAECSKLPEADLVCAETARPPDPEATCGTLPASVREACKND